MLLLSQVYHVGNLLLFILLALIPDSGGYIFARNTLDPPELVWQWPTSHLVGITPLGTAVSNIKRRVYTSASPGKCCPYSVPQGPGAYPAIIPNSRQAVGSSHAEMPTRTG